MAITSGDNLMYREIKSTEMGNLSLSFSFPSLRRCPSAFFTHFLNCWARPTIFFTGVMSPLAASDGDKEHVTVYSKIVDITSCETALRPYAKIH